MKSINVTKSFLPDIKEYTAILSKAWENEWLTNRGELVCLLEKKLTDRYSLNHIVLTTNGTLPIQIAIKLLGEQGEIITTPFSYVATTSSIVWENCIPIFVDIEEDTFSINAQQIEAAITPKTKAILATHVFGNPCDIDAINALAKKYNLFVIYDAAHCFGVSYKNHSIFNYGDISTCSFHATKIFHTAEGGAMFVNRKELQQHAYYSHNFGHNGPLNFHGIGINAKMSELQAAMGLSVFNHLDTIFKERERVVNFYKEHLDFSKVRTMRIREHTQWNNSYFPIIFNTEEELLMVQARLNENRIFPRRYFYPSLNNLPYVKCVAMKQSDQIAKTILCLPLYVGLQKHDLELIVNIINKHL